MRRNTLLACFAVMACAAFLLFNRLGEVRAPVWDEAYYLPAAARYHQHRLQFASHPPLGLMLIAAGDALYGGNAHVDQRAMAGVKAIPAEAMPRDYDYLGPRLMPALFGVLGAGLFFMLMAQLSGSTGKGLVLSALYLCNTALLAQSRAAHLDPFQIAFVLAALLCLARGLRRPSLIMAAGFGLFIAAAALVRAQAIVLAPMGLFLLWPHGRRAGIYALAGLGGALLALMLVIMAHGWASPRLPDASGEAGARDIAFLSPAIIRAGGLDPTDPVAMARMAGDYARFMAVDHDHMARRDVNGSMPWQWVIGRGAVTYRWDAGGGRVAVIALLPNMAVWLLSLIGVGAMVAGWRRGWSAMQGALLLGWGVMMGALMLIGGARVLYLYAYFLPLLLGHAMLALCWGRGEYERLARIALAAVTAGFLITAPLALHHRVTPDYCRIFLRDCGP